MCAAIRKKYRGFYMQTFYTLMKSEAEYHPNSRVLQEMLARAKGEAWTDVRK